MPALQSGAVSPRKNNSKNNNSSKPYTPCKPSAQPKCAEAETVPAVTAAAAPAARPIPRTKRERGLLAWTGSKAKRVYRPFMAGQRKTRGGLHESPSK
ncbi:hypothetical protein VTH06DRAFT_3111 [Thermothelomyces fergusii]